jgi:hypothetical protein
MGKYPLYLSCTKNDISKIAFQMVIQVLETEIKGRVRKDDELKLALAKANAVKVDTVNRWLREDDVMLTTVTNLEIIRKGLALTDDVPLTEPRELEPAK